MAIYIAVSGGQWLEFGITELEVFIRFMLFFFYFSNTKTIKLNLFLNMILLLLVVCHISYKLRIF